MAIRPAVVSGAPAVRQRGAAFGRAQPQPPPVGGARSLRGTATAPQRCAGTPPRMPVSTAGLAPAAAALAAGAAALRRKGGRGSGAARRERRADVPEVAPCDLPEGMEMLGNDTPGNAWALGVRVFNKELGQLILLLRRTPPFDGLAPWLAKAFPGADLSPAREPPAVVELLELDVAKVAAREEARGVPESSPPVKAVFFVLCWSLDRLYEGRPIQKFWVLETVARLPYFSYVTVLHLYESLGWWRTPQMRDLHSAEEHNELHHLLIMESLGGNCAWADRFAAQHAALLYYWVVVGFFLASPQLAYNFSHLVEEHAFMTYSEFVEANREVLSQIPAPPVARQYYKDGDLYYFDKFQTGWEEGLPRRRPPCDSLLDVFCNIRDDELEHIKTMKACQEWGGGDGPSPLPGPERVVFGKREEWLKWSAQVNALALRRGAAPGKPPQPPV